MAMWVSILGKGTAQGHRAVGTAVHVRGSEKAGVAGAERERMSRTGGQRVRARSDRLCSVL